jgi:hypothetical protein
MKPHHVKTGLAAATVAAIAAAAATAAAIVAAAVAAVAVAIVAAIDFPLAAGDVKVEIASRF